MVVGASKRTSSSRETTENEVTPEIADHVDDDDEACISTTAASVLINDSSCLLSPQRPLFLSPPVGLYGRFWTISISGSVTSTGNRNGLKPAV